VGQFQLAAGGASCVATTAPWPEPSPHPAAAPTRLPSPRPTTLSNVALDITMTLQVSKAPSVDLPALEALLSSAIGLPVSNVKVAFARRALLASVLAVTFSAMVGAGAGFATPGAAAAHATAQLAQPAFATSLGKQWQVKVKVASTSSTAPAAWPATPSKAPVRAPTRAPIMRAAGGGGGGGSSAGGGGGGGGGGATASLNIYIVVGAVGAALVLLAAAAAVPWRRRSSKFAAQFAADDPAAGGDPEGGDLIDAVMGKGGGGPGSADGAFGFDKGGSVVTLTKGFARTPKSAPKVAAAQQVKVRYAFGRAIVTKGGAGRDEPLEGMELGAAGRGGGGGGGGGGNTADGEPEVFNEDSLMRLAGLNETRDDVRGAMAAVFKIPFGELELERKPFARGGGGEVFKGEYGGNQIAAKHVYSSASSSAEFKHEVATLSKLSHPCVMALYGISTGNQGETYMVLEYCGGGDLKSYYPTEQFTKLEFARIANELLSGVTYLHQRNLAHRDLKPANILLETATMRVKIADFGLAKGTAHTATQGIGTPAYMAPETFEEQQGKGDSNLLALDVYAVGVILWELWHQTAPFAGLPVARVVAHVMRGKRLPFTDVEGDEPAPELFRALVGECWHQAPAQRPAAAAVARAVKKLFPVAAVKLARRRSLSNASTASRDQVGVPGPPPGSPGSPPWPPRSPAGSPGSPGSPGSVQLRKRLSSKNSALEGVAEGGLLDLDAAAKAQSPYGPPPLTLPGPAGALSVPLFLAGCGLDAHAGKFDEYGFTDVGMLGDRELLDDDTLLSVIGLTKAEVRLFRGRIAATGASPTVMRSRTLSKSKLGGKADPSEHSGSASASRARAQSWSGGQSPAQSQAERDAAEKVASGSRL
jgi:serine/threonine protein kinase